MLKHCVGGGALLTFPSPHPDPQIDVHFLWMCTPNTLRAGALCLHLGTRRTEKKMAELVFEPKNGPRLQTSQLFYFSERLRKHLPVAS